MGRKFRLMGADFGRILRGMEANFFEIKVQGKY